MNSAASRIARLTGLAVREARVAGSQHGYQHLMITLAGGQRAFAKALPAAPDAVAGPGDRFAGPPDPVASPGDRFAGSPDPVASPGDGAAGPPDRVARPGDGAAGPPDRVARREDRAAGEPDPVAAAFAAEANGLRWLAEAQAVPVPRVLAVTAAALVVSMIRPGQATPDAAFRFGADLALLHAAGADGFGAPWPGFIASLPLDNTLTPADREPWPEWYAARRLAPYLRMAADSGALRPEDARPVQAVIDRIASLAGPGEPPSRIHGDCWAGNVLWSGGRGWLIDPAAHGGHRETDLAMLALFGAPHMDRILAGYQDARPLAAGWKARVPLHQLHPLLVHACLFGTSYREQVRAAARAALAA